MSMEEIMEEPSINVVPKIKQNRNTLLWFGDEDHLKYKARCTNYPYNVIEVGGCTFIQELTFLNIGKVAWPININLIRIRGAKLEFKILEKEVVFECGEFIEKMNIVLEFKVPLNPGTYDITLGLVHGFDDSFQIGEEVTFEITSKDNIFDTMQTDQFNLDNFFNFAIGEPVEVEQAQSKEINPYAEILGDFDLENFFNLALNEDVTQEKEIMNPMNLLAYIFSEEKQEMYLPEKKEEVVENTCEFDPLDSNSEAALNLSNESWQFVEDDFESSPVGDQIVQYEEADVCESPENIVKVTQTPQDYDDEKKIFAYNAQVFMSKYDR